MLLRDKVALIVIFPMLLLSVYQFVSIEQAFYVISDVRSNVFVESVKEVKYANDVEFLTALMNSTLWDLENAYERDDAESFERVLRTYREIQQQRYYALQELKEVLSESHLSVFEFSEAIDANKLGQIAHVEEMIEELDGHNEKIISTISHLHDSDDSGAMRFEHIQKSNELTRQIVQELAAFTNTRYVKVSETSKLVAVSEKDAQNLLRLVVLIGYLMATVIVAFVYSFIIAPLERFSRAIDLKGMDKIAWTSMEPIRKDEIGQLYRALDECFARQRAHASSSEQRAAKKGTRRSRKSASRGKNGNEGK